MRHLIVIGSCRGEVVFDLDGLFRIIKLESACPDTVLKELEQAGFKGVILRDLEAICMGTSIPLRASWNDTWLRGLIHMISASGPFEAAMVTERIFLRRIFSQALAQLLEIEEALDILREYAGISEETNLRWASFAQAREWHAWIREIEDIKPRIRNLQLSLGRFAVRLGLGSRWLKRGDG